MTNPRIPPSSNRPPAPSRTNAPGKTTPTENKKPGPAGPDNATANEVFDKLLKRMVEQAGDTIQTTRKELEKFAKKREPDEDEE